MSSTQDFLKISLILFFKVSTLKSNKLGHGARIIGGSVCEVQEYPFVVAIFGASRCGGTMLTYDWILTAAHCLQNRADELQVRSGFHAGPNYVQERNGVHSVVHQKFDMERLEQEVPELRYDIGLLMVDKPFTPSVTAQPVTLPSLGLTQTCKKGFVLGIGYEYVMPSFRTNTKDDPLKCVELNIANQSMCSRTYKDSIVDESIVCTLEDVEGKDACFGDSGGPLLCDDTKIIIGIVSFGKGCGNAGLAATYTSVERYLGFVRANVLTSKAPFQIAVHTSASGNKNHCKLLWIVASFLLSCTLWFDVITYILHRLLLRIIDSRYQ